VVEGGQHNSPESVRSLESSIWLVMEHLGLIRRGSVEQMSEYRQYLVDRTHGMPDYIEITHRHEIHPKDEFQMKEGYLNFQRVNEGEYLARDRFGKIYAPFDGIILLPLYQGLGNDGFFIGRKISERALDISSLLRKFRFDAFLSAMPGIRTCQDSENTLMVNPEVLRSKRAEWLYLMGYRKLRKSDDRYLAKKRPE
jgi:succinylglutamate desuccinylase